MTRLALVVGIAYISLVRVTAGELVVDHYGGCCGCDQAVVGLTVAVLYQVAVGAVIVAAVIVDFLRPEVLACMR